MRGCRLSVVTSAAVTVLALGALPASSANDPAGVITDLASRVLDMRTGLTAAERQQGFRALVREDFDFPAISRFVLGRYWDAENEAAHQQFVGAFEQYVVRVYAERFKDFAAERLNVTRQWPHGTSGTIISTELLRENGDPPIKIDWRVRKSEATYKIADVIVAGVSMIQAQREEFASIIERNGGSVPALVELLRERSADTASASAAARP